MWRVRVWTVAVWIVAVKNQKVSDPGMVLWVVQIQLHLRLLLLFKQHLLAVFEEIGGVPFGLPR